MQCAHSQTVFTEFDTVVCTVCGLEKSILYNTPNYHTHITTAPLARFYSRPDRWNTLLKKIIAIHSGPPTSDPIWVFLKEKQPFKSVDDLKTALRNCRLENKHYPCIHVFARCFCSDYKKPRHNPREVLHKLGVYFDLILKMYHRSGNPNKKFFSYNWLLEQGLSLFNFVDYIPFVKKLKCVSRRCKYVEKLIALYETHVQNDGCELLNSHLQNGLLRVEIHQNLLLQRQHPCSRKDALIRKLRTHPQTCEAEVHVLAHMLLRYQDDQKKI